MSIQLKVRANFNSLSFVLVFFFYFLFIVIFSLNNLKFSIRRSDENIYYLRFVNLNEARMFKNLRKKVNSVLPDIENIYISSANGLSNSSSPITIKNHFGLALPTLSSSASASSDASKVQISHWPNTSLINFNAGCQLLEKNEHLWEELHVANELNSKKAEECDSKIAQLSDSVGKRCIDLSDINVSLELIPNILQTLENCSASIIDVNDKCTEVEIQLFELEDLMDILRLQEQQLDKKFEMAMYKEHKLANLERVRQDLVSKHAETIKESEQQMRQVQQERQAVFQDAFQSDMKYYKEVGKIPKIENKTNQQILSLEEIVLDNESENKELDAFLNE